VIGTPVNFGGMAGRAFKRDLKNCSFNKSGIQTKNRIYDWILCPKISDLAIQTTAVVQSKILNQ
jgi:hypothetical protein